MTIADDVQRLIPDFRASALSLMVDTATIERAGTGEPVFDPNTGTITPPAGSTVYTGPCRLRQPSPSESEVMFGDQQLTLTRFIACLPHDTVGVAIGDVITITESADPDVIGRRFRAMSIPLATFTIYKGFAVELVE